MRMSRKAGLLIASTVCGALTLGVSAPTWAATDATSHSAHTAAAPLPDADKVASQTSLLADAGGVLTPVTDLLTAVLKAPDGKLPEADAASLSKAAKDALAKAAAAAPATPGTPEVPAAPDLPATPDLPGLPATPGTSGADDQATGADQKAPAPDLTAKAAADLQTKVDALLKASRAGDPAAIAKALQDTVTGLVNLLASLVLGGALPAPDLAGLPALPTLPTVPGTPAVPGATG